MPSWNYTTAWTTVGPTQAHLTPEAVPVVSNRCSICMCDLPNEAIRSNRDEVAEELDSYYHSNCFASLSAETQRRLIEEITEKVRAKKQAMEDIDY